MTTVNPPSKPMRPAIVRTIVAVLLAIASALGFEVGSEMAYSPTPCDQMK